MGRALADRAIVAAALLALLGSGAALLNALSAEPWARLAARIEAAPGPLDISEGFRERLTERLSRPDAGPCDWDLPRSKVTIGLDLLRRSTAPEVPVDQREQASRNAEIAVRNAILCNAADGNLWYLQALLEYRATSDWTRAEPFLVTSALLSPFEGDLLLRRAELVALALRKQGTALDPNLKADLGHAVAEIREAPAAAILAGLREAGRGELADALMADLPPERREALARGGAAQRSTFGRAERYRHFEFRPFGDAGP